MNDNVIKFPCDDFYGDGPEFMFVNSEAFHELCAVQGRYEFLRKASLWDRVFNWKIITERV